MLSERMNRQFERRGTCGILLAAGLAMVTPALQAQTLTWNNVAGGSAGTAANWNPVQIPVAANILNFGLAGNYAISFPATVPTSAQQNYNVGTLSISTLSPHTATAQLVVGLSAGSTPNVTFTGGSLSSSVIAIAANATSTSTFNISGPTADVFSTGASGVRIGNGGNGTLNITNGGSLQSTNAVSVSPLAGSQGAVTVSGVNGATRSQLITTDLTGGDLNVAQAGTGSLNIALGGRVDIADDAFIAPTAAFTGSTTVGSTVATGSTFDMAGDLHIGHNATAAAGGAGTLTVNSGGTVTVAGNTFIGDSAGGTGTLVMNQGGSLITTSLTIDSAHGVLTHTGGLVKLIGGVLTVPSNQLIINGITASDLPFLSLDNSTATLSAAAGSRALTVGTTRQARAGVQAGAVLTIPSGDVVLGDLAGSNGTFQTQLGGLLSIAGPGMFTVGNGGSGNIVFGVDGRIASGSVQAAVGATSTGSINITTPATTFDITGTLALGGTIASLGGAASMIIGGGTPDSGTVHVTSGLIAGGINTRIWPGSSLTINTGGTLVSDQVVRINGSLSLDGGTIDANNLVTTGPGPYPMRGTIVGGMQPQSSGVVNLTGPLTVGSLRNEAIINVGANTLTINDTQGNNAWFIGNCTVGAGGHIVAPGGLTINAGLTLSGEGSVDAPVLNLGTVSGTGSGLALNGLVTGLGEGIGGTAITFGPGGGFTGAGGFSTGTSVSAQAGSVVTATSFLQMGNASSASGFSSLGRIVTSDNFIVTLRDSNGATVHDVDFLNPTADDPPSVLCSSGMQVNGLVGGTGIIGGNSHTFLQSTGATFSPGTAAESGSIMLNSDTFFNPTTRVEIDIFDAASHDEVRSLSHLTLNPLGTIPSDITLDGTLVLRVAPGHTPVSGETHHVVITNHGFLGPDGRVFGNFGALDVPRHWLIKVVPTESTGQENGVFAIYCTADFNEDGTVDFFDYLDFVDAFSSGDGTADFNADTTIDFFDYLDFVDAFSTGC